MKHPKQDPRRRSMLKTVMKSVCDANKVPIQDLLKYRSSHPGYIVLFDDFLFIGDKLSLGAKECWIAHLLHVDRRNPDLKVMWPSRERIATIMGLKSVRQVDRYRHELRNTNPPLLISRRRQDKTTLHVLLDPPASWSNKIMRKLKDEKVRSRQRTG